MADDVYGEPPSAIEVAALAAVLALAVDRFVRNRARRTIVENARDDPAKPKCRWVVEADACEYCKNRGSFLYEPDETPMSSHRGCKCHPDAVFDEYFVSRYQNESFDDTQARVALEEREIQKAINREWLKFKANETQENYGDTVGAYIESFSPQGLIRAEYRAKPKAKELLAGEKMAANGHEIVFLPETGSGKHPDVLIDGVIADFKRMESENPDKVYDRIKDASRKADMAVIDLSLRSIDYLDAMTVALKAIDDGIIDDGMVIVLDWDGAEIVV